MLQHNQGIASAGNDTKADAKRIDAAPPERKQEQKASEANEPAALAGTDELATQLKKHYSQHSKLYTLFSRVELPIIDINLSLVEYRAKPHPEAKQTRIHDRGDTKEEVKDTPVFTADEHLAHARVAMKIEDLFTPRPDEKSVAPQSLRRLLITGDAGVGKTTMSQYIVYRWATTTLWTDRFDYVFWVPLRDLTATSTPPRSLAQVVTRHCLKELEVEITLVNTIEQVLKDTTKSSRILWLLDGYDEVNHLVEESNTDYAVLLNKLLTQPQVILTSRPYYVQQLKARFDRHLENSGFDEKQIQAYIQYYFSASPARSHDLQAFLTANASLGDVAHIPIQLSLLCDLWQHAVESKELLPTDMSQTRLYQHISEYLLKEQLKKQSVVTRGMKLANLLGKYQAEVMLLGHLAFEALQTTEKVLLTPALQKRIQAYQPSAVTFSALFDSTLKLGFLRTLSEAKCDEIEKPHEFLHLSFQEFWAAYYVFQSLQQPGTPAYERVKEFIRQQKYMARYQRMFAFVSGWLSNDSKATQSLQDFWQTILAPPVDLVGIGHLRLMMICLEEGYHDKRVEWKSTLLTWIQQGLEQTLRLGVRTENGFFQQLMTTLQQTPKIACCEEIMAVWLKALGDAEGDVRARAAEALGGLGKKAANESVIAALVKTLGDAEGDVRARAAEALGRLGEKAASEPAVVALVKTLGDAEGDVRARAAEALGCLGEKVVSESVIAALLKALGDPEEDVRANAAVTFVTLGGLGEKAVSEPVVVALVKALGDPEVKPRRLRLVKTLGDDAEGYVRANAAYVLGGLGEKAASESVIAALLKALGDPKEYVRARAAEALGGLDEKAASEPVVAALVKALGDAGENDYSAMDALIKIKRMGKVADEKVIGYLLSGTLNESSHGILSAFPLKTCFDTYFASSHLKLDNLVRHVNQRSTPLTFTSNRLVIYDNQRSEVKLADSTQQKLATQLLHALMTENERSGVFNVALLKLPVALSVPARETKSFADAEATSLSTLFYRTALLREEWESYDKKATHTLFSNKHQGVKIKLQINHPACQKDVVAVLDPVLSANRTVAYLDLSNNCLDDLGAFYLAKFIETNKHLKTLVLSNNFITEKGLDDLLKAANQNSSLRYLFLDGNHIAFDDYFCKKKVESLLTNSSLMILDLSMNFICPGVMLEEKGAHGKNVKVVYDESTLKRKLAEQKFTDQDRFYCQRYLEDNPIVRSHCLPAITSVLDPDKQITAEKGLVMLAAYKTKLPPMGEHAFLVIEELQSFGQRRLIMGDLYVTDKGIHIQVAQCSPEDYLHRTGHGQRIEANCALIPSDQLQAVINKMLEYRDRKEFLRYQILPSNRASVFNCVTWAYKMLLPAGIMREPESLIPSKDVGQTPGRCVIS